jgi:hypothetical protein
MVLSNFSSQITNSNFSVVLTNHTEEFMKLKFEILLARIKATRFSAKNFSKPVEKISNFLSIVIKIYQGTFYKVFAP